MSLLQTGIAAPDFTLADHTGAMRTLSELKGSYVVIYFYPKDDTPGCTKEACMIRDIYHDFEKAGITVIGISKDSPASHAKFREKYELPFILLSDPEKHAIGPYGASQLIGTKRISYIIDPNGVIVGVYPNVDPAGHAMQLLQDIKNLQNK